MDEEVTLGELVRTLRKLDETMTEKFKALDTRLDNDHHLLVPLYEAEKKMQDSRIETIEESLRWFRRTLIAIVLAVVVPTIYAVLTIRQGA